MSPPRHPTTAERARSRPRMRVTGIQAGVVMALAAVAAGAFFEVRPPDAYGICMSCHTRDVVGWISNRTVGSDITVSQASLVFPVLTTIGVVIGALLAALLSKEFRWRPPSRPARSFLYGVLVMNAALIAAGCATRLTLRTSAGDIAGVVGFIAMAGGVALATFWLRRKALR